MENIETCESEIIHEDTVKKVKATFLKDEMILTLLIFTKSLVIRRV